MYWRSGAFPAEMTSPKIWPEWLGFVPSTPQKHGHDLRKICTSLETYLSRHPNDTHLLNVITMSILTTWLEQADPLLLRLLDRLSGSWVRARCSWSQVSAFQHYHNLPLVSSLSQSLSHSMRVTTYAPPFRTPFSGLWKICTGVFTGELWRELFGLYGQPDRRVKAVGSCEGNSRTVAPVISFTRHITVYHSTTPYPHPPRHPLTPPPQPTPIQFYTLYLTLHQYNSKCLLFHVPSVRSQRRSWHGVW